MSTGYYYNPAAYPTATYQSTHPIAVPPKQPGTHPYYAQPQYANYGPYSRLSVSPPESAGSGTTSGVASYEPSAASSSYAGSASDYDTSGTGASGVDLLEYMSDRLNSSYNPLPLDRGLVQQTQTSGQLNAKHRELLELQARARQRLAAVQADFADGMKTAKQVQRDLEWTQKRVASINDRAARKYPTQYAAASARYPAPIE